MRGTDLDGLRQIGREERRPKKKKKDQKVIEERSVLKAGGIKYLVKFVKDKTKRTQLDLVTRSLFVCFSCVSDTEG